MKKNCSRLFDLVFWMLIIGMIAFSVIFAIQSKHEQKYILGYQGYIVLTGSMEPAIETKSLVVVKKVDINKIEVGDVITYRPENTNSIVTHRVNNIIIEDDKVKIETKGDANNAIDIGYVVEENLIGEVVKVIPKLGGFSQSIKKAFSYL